MIRKSVFVIILIVCLLISGSVYLFIDKLILNLTETVLEKYVQIDVVIEGLKTKMTDLEVSFEKFQIKDPNNNQRNLVDTGPARFDLFGMQLLAKKVVINEISLHAIRLDSDFDKIQSTAVSADQPVTPEDQEQDESPSLESLSQNLPEINLDSILQELDVDKYVHPEKLKSVIAIKKAENEGQEKIAYWNSVTKNNNLQQDISQIQIDADRFRGKKISTLRDFQIAQKEWASLQTRIIKTRKAVDRLHRQATEDLGFVRINYDQITPLMEQDYEGAKDLAKLKDINAANVGKLLFGQEVVNRYQQVTRYLNLAREFFGDDKKKKVVKNTGRDAEFPVRTMVYPAFFIKNMMVDGHMVDEGLNPLYNLSGTITDFNFDQKISQKPTVFEIAAKDVKKGAVYVIEGSFDFTGDDYKNSIFISGSQLRLIDIELKREGGVWPTSMNSKDADLSVRLVLTEKTLDGEILLTAKSVKFAFMPKTKTGQLGEIVREIFEDFKSLHIKSTLKGKLSDPEFSVSTNIDSIITRRLNKLVGRKLKEAQDKIRKRIQGEVDKQRNAATERINQEKAKVLKRVNSYKAEVRKSENQARAQVAAYQAMIKRELEKQKRELEKQKKKAEEELKRNLKGQLKRLFN